MFYIKEKYQLYILGSILSPNLIHTYIVEIIRKTTPKQLISSFIRKVSVVRQQVINIKISSKTNQLLDFFSYSFYKRTYILPHFT